jgi:hypothetical protein
MAGTMKGSCLCGKVRFEAQGAPLFQGFCQCLDCRKIGSGRAAVIGLPEQAVKVSGETRAYGKPGESGKTIYRNFCPNCGSMVFDRGEAFPGVTIVYAALLDDPEMFKPQMAIYARSALSWDHMDPALPRFQAMPPQG